jgi:aspartyl-tRNA(Asn)/glutamyl-tRNA(Gln) amidotransferase subunit C
MAESKISLEQVRHVALLARLHLSPEEEQRLVADMSSMLGYVETLNELDTSNVPPTAQVGEPSTPMRDDVVTNHPAPEDMLANAPARSALLTGSGIISPERVIALIRGYLPPIVTFARRASWATELPGLTAPQRLH